MIVLITLLATYYTTLVLTEYDGPGLAFTRLRNRYKEPLDCFVCLSPYVALVFSIVAVDGFKNILMLTIASAGGATFLSKFLENLWNI